MKWFPQFAIALCSFTAVSAQAQQFNFPHIATSGYGEVTAVPDRAQFSVKVVETNMNAEQAKATVDNVVAEFTSQLKQSGVEAQDISSSNLYLTPQYHYPKSGQPELVGYRAQRSITVEVAKVSQLNQYLDLALAQGINQVDNVQLKVSEQEKYQAQARMAAITDAKKKAESLASGFKAKLGSVWRIEYNSMTPQPVLMRSANMSEKALVNDTYQDSTLVIRDRVDVIYKLAP
ncbi:oxidative stress defense protein [Vibrio cincinnatiensis]|uniref:oxidative stress defense protein n=1 Tax=Vibrio cincinnatiensis TaxID=675 RepID=UPI001EDE1CC0|nr:oxidative stress defense protein [Vibrio cincinnatiensis]MCG3730164.1 oxidative stress defense protein [Vibrio cincinnatiensis]MCG3767508.1 oxidative stress defense protein [Vibrio cincinnatiensis]